ncbi:hypothetical protein XELAEV_18031995mg [Xenopus laevis]|uniref:Uncharacterized protein n=1 Tax=Xenopus laevis TaxID=8355 RepID=A0A974CP51_XENLA|nr:hypothetical protein XELAEV_18031995mg [Xenopus laevis]
MKSNTCQSILVASLAHLRCPYEKKKIMAICGDSFAILRRKICCWPAIPILILRKVQATKHVYCFQSFFFYLNI